MLIVIALLVTGWIAAAVIGTMAYFRGEQSKPIHPRNWNNQGFERVAVSVTGVQTNYGVRVPAYSSDPYINRNF
ncbi:MAG: hypothetical protein HC835_06640 [Oscillatoriales cyanobacterium RM2_1_1]|nr:hypothetical protein [Oscillatoriales cyanobacterium SM2_3_0]NJO45325.1 hypothetical protein [Oscillatoriales cyanobacterium RM2_1_1]